jgi:hypothetical protein
MKFYFLSMASIHNTILNIEPERAVFVVMWALRSRCLRLGLG